MAFIPMLSVSHLMEYDEVIAGVVYEVSGNETFTAWKDGGAWLNGKQDSCFESSNTC